MRVRQYRAMVGANDHALEGDDIPWGINAGRRSKVRSSR